MSELRKRIKKGWNFIIKSLVNVNRSVTFAPATAIDVHWNTDKQTELILKNIFKKKIPKSLWDLKTDVTFAPRKTTEVHWKIGKV